MSGFKLTVELLDKKICDVEEGASNTETYREFIHNYKNGGIDIRRVL